MPIWPKTIRYKDDYVLVKGTGMACGRYSWEIDDEWEGDHIEENVIASRMAYEEAGIKDPRKELDVAIVHDCFTITELTIWEDFGFSPTRGKGPEDAEAGAFEIGGELAVNTDGGLKSFGHPIGASGIRVTYEVYKQLQGKAEARQVKNPRLGLSHTFGGTPVEGGTGAVVILGCRE